MTQQEHFDCDFPQLEGDILELRHLLATYTSLDPERNTRRAEAVRLRLGLAGGDVLSFKKVGERMGISGSRADTLYYDARREIRSLMKQVST